MFFFSESGYGYGYGHGHGGYGGYGKGYGYYHYGKRGMKKMANHRRANNIPTKLNDDAGTEHLKQRFAEIKRNKAQLKAAH